MSRLLITGGAGFIGTAICRAAQDAGWTVRVLDSFRADVHGPGAAEPVGAQVVRGDVTDADTLDAALTDIDAVCHQAAKVGLGVDLADAPDYVRSNVSGTAELIAALHRHDIRRLVLASSMVVYGEGAYRRPGSDADAASIRPAARAVADLEAGVFEPRDPSTGDLLEPALVDEDAVLDPRNVYATTKLAQEHLAAVWAREAGGRVAMPRYHNVYGPGMPRDTPYAGVASLFRSTLERGEAPRVFEDGGQRRDFVHVRDVAAANIAALDWTAVDGPPARAFNVGSGRVSTVLDLAAALSAATDGPRPVVTGEFRLGDVRHITASSERAARELGWRAAIPFEDGVREFARAPLRA